MGLARDRERGGRVGQVREKLEEKYEVEGEDEEVEEVDELVEEEEETVGKEGLALTEGSTSLGAARIPTLATAASPKRRSSPGAKNSPLSRL